jgi:hypothetical protein
MEAENAIAVQGRYDVPGAASAGRGVGRPSPYDRPVPSGRGGALRGVPTRGALRGRGGNIKGPMSKHISFHYVATAAGT